MVVLLPITLFKPAQLTVWSMQVIGPFNMSLSHVMFNLMGYYPIQRSRVCISIFLYIAMLLRCTYKQYVSNYHLARSRTTEPKKSWGQLMVIHSKAVLLQQ